MLKLASSFSLDSKRVGFGGCGGYFLETGSHYVVQPRLELMILAQFSESPELWDYKHVPPGLA
jgi:hypothetical protein